MFTHLADFGRKRSYKEAFGFYIAYLALTLLGAMVVAIMLAFLFPGSGESMSSVAVGAVFAAFSCAALSYLVLKEKGLLKKFSSFAYVVGAAGISLVLGGIFGMLVVAYLTTKEGPATAM